MSMNGMTLEELQAGDRVYRHVYVGGDGRGFDLTDIQPLTIVRVNRKAGFGGNGKSVPCHHGCGRRVTARTMNVDRFPLCGHDGGRYVRGNIVPSCRPCNISRCDGCKGFRAKRGGYLDRERPDPREEEE